MAEISLAKLCLGTVAENIAFLCRDLALNDGSLESLHPYVGFSQLSDRAIQEILDVAFAKGILLPEHFALLVNQNVLKLDLSRYHSLITDQVLLQLGCKKLVSLNLQYGGQISSQCLNQIVQDLTCLTYLNLSHCLKCSDSVLESIAKHCPNLKHLNLESCVGITDFGIEALVKPSLEPLKILYLNVSSTSVSTQSLFLLLTGLPLLLSLSFAQLQSTNGKPIVDRRFMEQKIEQFQLQHLDMQDTQLFSFQMDELDRILESCPNLIELKLRISVPIFDCPKVQFFLKSATNLAILKYFHISGSAEGLSYHHSLSSVLPFELENILDFLKEIGHQLGYLNLTHIKNVKLPVVCLYCNSLKQLTLSRCHLVQPFFPCSETSQEECDKLSDFCSLQYIHLENLDLDDISLDLKQKLLYQLLTSHSNLLQLSLKTIPIEEECLIKVLQSSSGAQLEKLVLSCYDNITVKTLAVIEASCPNLKRLELFHSWVITWYNIWQINDRLKTNGGKLEIVAEEQNDWI